MRLTDPKDPCPVCMHSLSFWHCKYGCDVCDCKHPDRPPAVLGLRKIEPEPKEQQ